MKKSKVKIFVILIILIIIVSLIGVAYAFFKTDLFKTPDQLFAKYLLDGATQISNFNNEPYGTALERMKNEKTEIVYEIETAYTPNASDISFDTFEADIATEENNLLIKETMKMDNANNNYAYAWDVKNNDEYFFSLNFLKTDNTYGIYIPELHDKYISLEDRDIKKLVKTFGVEEEELKYVPDTIPKILFTEEENAKLKELTLKYFEKISTQINENATYTKEKYVIEDFYGENVEGNKYILTVPGNILSEITTKTVKEILEDPEVDAVLQDKLIGVVIQTVEYIVESFKSSFSNSAFEEDQSMSFSDMSELEENTTNDTKAEENITNDVEKDESSENVQICIYEYKGKTIKFEFAYEEGRLIEFMINNKENSSNILLSASVPKTETNEIGFESTLDLSNTYENNNGELILLLKNEYNQDDVKELKKANDDDGMSDFYDESYYKDKFKTTEMTYKIKTTTKDDVINSKLTYDVSEEMKDSLPSKVDMTMKFDPNLKIEKLTANNKLVVNDYSLEEFMTLWGEIQGNMIESSNENPTSLIGSTIKAQEEEKLETIADYKEDVYDDVKESIEYNLSDYHMDVTMDPNVNPGDYLTLDRIKEEAGWKIDEMELIDGTTLKCVIDEYVFYVIITIDGAEWKLIDLTVLYSEDGTLENAK